MRDAATRLTLLAIFVVTWGLTTHGKYSVTGDEPHYLMVTQSLVADGDIDVANNYARNDGARFGASGVQPEKHVRVTARGRTLPVGDIGAPLLLVPVFAVATRLAAIPDDDALRRFRMNRGLFAYSLISLALIALTTSAAAITMRALRKCGATSGEAAVTVAVVWLSPPVLSHAFLVFTEPFALFVTACAVLTWSREGRPWSRPDAATVLMLGLLPWIHRKFGLYVVALLAILVWRRRRDLMPVSTAAKALMAAAFVVPPVLLIVWSLREWGTMGGGLAAEGVPLRWRRAAEGIPALLVDRENGIFWWAPVNALLPAAFWIRRHALWPWPLAIALVLLPAAGHQWFGGFSPAGRFLVPFAPIACLAGTELVRRRPLRLVSVVLLVPQFILTAYAWQHPRLFWTQGDGENRVLATILPPLTSAYRSIPSFRTAPEDAWVPTAVLLALILVLNALLVFYDGSFVDTTNAQSRHRRSP